MSKIVENNEKDKEKNENKEATLDKKDDKMGKEEISEHNEALKMFKEELQALSIEIGHIKQDLDNTAKTIDGKLKGSMTEFKEQVSQLTRENLVLRKLPEKLEEKLHQIIPAISIEIQKKTFEGFVANTKLCNAKIKELEGKIEDAIQRVNSQENISFGKKALVFIALLFLSTISTLGTSYFILEKFPRFIKIETEGNINIESSANNHVSVWDAKAVKEALKKKK